MSGEVKKGGPGGELDETKGQLDPHPPAADSAAQSPETPLLLVNEHGSLLLSAGKALRVIDVPSSTSPTVTGGTSIASAEQPQTGPVDWEKVHRKRQVYMLGDLWGSLQGFRQNLTDAQAAKLNGRLAWTGGPADLVLLGDIVGDRLMEGFPILLEAEDLEREKKNEGGKMIIIRGNHDSWMEAFLMGIATPEGADPIERMAMIDDSGAMQGLGMFELVQFGTPALKAAWNEGGAQHPQILYLLKEARLPILKNMREHPEGRRILEMLCRMQLAHRTDDSLFVHAPPHEGILKQLLPAHGKQSLDERIAELNNFYESMLKKGLSQGYQLRAAELARFQEIRAAFLSTDIRNNFLQSLDIEWEDVLGWVARLRNAGINVIFHGHQSGEPTKEGQFMIVSVDRGAFWKPNYTGNSRSIASIHTDGTIILGENHTPVRQRVA